ncbi:hypothetical protein L1987_52853 [Smallanthus sonchifolius]|uniref:Uncharacterized protein n=1 Tax=Smallanthus sonchifolius TaxID=185202 RepID=A0ACB9EV22_9ASTR|nr:hypothetical protein L1987_52853 [Smallanthus sonchifolius]
MGANGSDVGQGQVRGVEGFSYAHLAVLMLITSENQKKPSTRMKPKETKVKNGKNLIFVVREDLKSKPRGVSKDTIYLRFFPFSLSWRASTWLDNLPENSITTWEDLETKFF